MGSIFRRDGRAFIMAIDHPLTMSSPEMEDIADIISKAVEGGVDAFMASYGCIRHFGPASEGGDRFAGKGLILRADGGSVIMGKPIGELKLLYNAEDAKRIGADALLCMGYPGSTVSASTISNVAQTVRSAHSAGLAAAAEMLPYGFEHPDGIDTRSVGNVSFACRLGAELGADFVKTEFVGGERFSEVVRSCYVPVLILGGSKFKTEDELLDEVSAAMAAGASGVIMGRNIARSEDITGLCRKISAIVHK